MRELKFRAWYGKKFNYFSLGETNKYPSNVMDFPVNQYTGLKDMNGKEIYEGDIISTDLERPLNKVIFKNGCFMLECYDQNYYHDIFFSTSELQKEVYQYAKVIGNIYENPEYL